VTALSFIRGQATHQPFLLAGEGPFLKIYEHGSTASTATGVLLQQRVFRSQAVHGIAVEETTHPRPPRILVWGGYSVRILELLQFDDQQTEPTPRLEIVNLGQELNATDWILDASFSPSTPGGSHVSAALVTAHNSLHLLRLSRDNGNSDLQNQLFSAIGSSSRSILYSAHVLWVSSDGVLVAAGTVFGEILVWSCDLGNKSKALLHYTLAGHEGSIFGVQISPLLGLGKHRPQRLLASCSDDRTIRIWDISAQTAMDNKSLVNTSTDTGFCTTGDSTPRGLSRPRNLIAIGWGHTSRVWGVRFIGHHAKQMDVLSFGEDATCRQWSLRREDGAVSNSTAMEESLNLTQTYNLHSGKHIWSLAVLMEDTSLLISTGGSDGKIASVSLQQCADGAIIHQRYGMEWTLEDIESFSRSHTFLYEAPEDGTPRPSSDRSLTTDKDSRAGINGTYSKKPIRSKPTRNEAILSPDILKDYAFISQTEFLTSTTKGRVFLCCTELPRSGISLRDNAACQVRWKSLVDLDMLGSYPVVTSDPASKVAFLSGSGGLVYIYDHASRELKVLFQIDGKVSGLFPMSSPCE
jgi:WD repeat-containing protein 6